MPHINTIPPPPVLQRQVAMNIDINNINRPRSILSCLNPDLIPASRSSNDGISTEIDDDDEIVLLKKFKHN